MREAENKKRQLEEAADALREECARLQVSFMWKFFTLIYLWECLMEYTSRQVFNAFKI